MGRKVKKKNNRTPLKEKRVASSSPIVAPQQSSTSFEIVDDSLSVEKERKQCCHIDKCLNLNELSSKIGSSESISCEDCRECAADRRGSKGRAKHGKKKGGNSGDVKADSRAIWICLQCGHYACGGIGLPTNSQSHAVWHVRKTRHPVVIQFENPQLRWCFSCNTLIPVEKKDENCDQKDSLFNVVKLIRERSTQGSPAVAENSSLASSEVTIATKSESYILSDLDRRNYHVVKGLINLGNTCFFNSVLQNLLALDMLRDFFVNLEECVGPLSMALKKLFIEARMGGRIKGTINPRSVFGCISAKAPQFKGYEQHDSHELLRVLLDGLSTEELALRKTELSKGKRISANPTPTFVDEMFGGKIASTVCCMECGHTSTVYEPFLDLSLSVPTKKPLTKKAQPARAKKTKMQSKRSGKTMPKANKSVEIASVQSAAAPSANSEDSLPAEAGFVGTTSVVVGKVLDSQNVSDVQESEREPFIENGGDTDNLTWLDFLGPEPNAENYEISVTQDSESSDKVFDNDHPLRSVSESNFHSEPNKNSNFSSVNPWDDESPIIVQASEVLLLPYKEESTTSKGVEEENLASSSTLGCAQDDSDGFGFGDMFDEPEVTAGSIARASVNEVTDFLAGNASESDPDEVDNTNSPVSVESCLSYFTKPELLSDENGYNCENCSKRLQRQRLEEQEKQSKGTCKVLANGHQTREGGDESCSNEETSVEISDHNNVNLNNDSNVCNSGESLIMHENTDCSSQNCTKHVHSETDELSPIILREEESKGVIRDMNHGQLYSSDSNNTCNQESSSDKSDHSFSVDNPRGSRVAETDKEPFNSQVLTGNCQSEMSEDGELGSDSTTVTVKRDATKRLFIHKAPPILTIHLKRFSPDARGRYSKLNGHVSFKETIDLKPYMDTGCADTDKCSYRLVGVVEHSGSMRGGHYVAYVRGGSSSNGKAEKEGSSSVWYLANDGSVREVSLNEVLGREAYILFYEIT